MTLTMLTPTTARPDRTQSFLDALVPHAMLPLVFMLNNQVLVHEGYHVTEVKAVSIQAMDCGGRPDAWNETVVQLWNPGDETERGFMTVQKFLDIYHQVAGRVPVQGDAALRFEYGDTQHPTIQYTVSDLVLENGRVEVKLSYPAVACKPRAEEELQGLAVVSCCGPGQTC